MRLWDPERCEHGIAGELFDDTAVDGDTMRDALEELRHPPADNLGIGARDEACGVDDVDEEDGCQLAFHR